MLTAGQLLKQVRATKGLSLDLIAAQTNIKKEYLKAIEADEYDKLPSEISANGFVGVYAEFLGIDKNRALALKRRAQQESMHAKQELTQRKSVDTAKVHGWQKIAGIAGIAAVVLGVIMYIFFQIRSFQTPPSLEIIKPDSDMTVSTSMIQIEGLTDTDSVLTLNDATIDVRNNGFFTTEYTLTPGVNTLVFKATKKSNQTKVSQVIRKIRYDAPEITTDTQEPSNGAQTDNANLDSTQQQLNADNLSIKASNPVWLALDIDGKNILSTTLQSGDEESFEAKKEISINTALPNNLTVMWGDNVLPIHEGITTCTKNNQDITCL